MKPATFEINKGKVSVQARVTAQQAQGSFSIQNLQLESLAPKSFPLKGTITAQATLSGTGSQPVIHGDIRLGTTCIKTVEVSSVQTSFTYQDNRLSLNGGLTTKQKGLGLTWSGYVPMRLSLVPLAYGLGQGEMQIAVQGQNVNLSLLPSLVQGVDDAKGAVDIQVRIAGTVSQPQVSGQMSWGDGHIKLRATGATYTLQPGKILMKGDHITIPQLTLQSEGTATLTGDIALGQVHALRGQGQAAVQQLQGRRQAPFRRLRERRHRSGRALAASHGQGQFDHPQGRLQPGLFEDRPHQARQGCDPGGQARPRGPGRAQKP